MKSLILAALLAAAAAPSFAQAPAQSAAPSPPPTAAAPAGETSAPAEARAGQTGAMATVMKTCSADFQAQCPGQTGSDLQACVRTNFDKLSEGCRASIMTMMSGGGER